MKRWLFLLIGALFLFGLHREQNEIHVEELKKNSLKDKPVNHLTTYIPRRIPARPPVVKSERKPASFVKKSRPQKISGLVIAENAIRIGKTFKVVDGVATMDKSKYKSSFGKKISEDANYVFFQPASAAAMADALPVALSSTNLKLYPISHILHVKGIDADERAQFKAEGMQEYYYHSRLKFISLETTPSTVMKQFQALTARGFDVSLEVLKETPHSK
jgi:hypothetical protein